jgi:hypothetical protein
LLNKQLEGEKKNKISKKLEFFKALPPRKKERF